MIGYMQSSERGDRKDTTNSILRKSRNILFFKFFLGETDIHVYIYVGSTVSEATTV